MSVRIMTAAWAVDMAAPEKLVLLALADCANDEGHCWPGLASLARKTGKCKRSLQESLRALTKDGHITRTENPGKGMNYVVHPVAKSAPVEEITTGSKICTGGKKTYRPVAKSAPKPLRTISSEPNGSSPRKGFPKPDGVDEQVWRDFLANRHRKRLPNTPTAHKRLMDDLSRFTDSDWPIPKLMEHAAAKGWAGIYDPRGDPMIRGPTKSVRNFEDTVLEELGYKAGGR